jgi:hypothetical protein
LDPRAERLHDVSGHLLLFHFMNGRLPRTLDELAALDAGKAPALVCPDSGKPYVYEANGLQIPGQSGRLMLYEPTASRPGMRWGVLVGDPEPGKPLIVRVVLLPENAILAAGRKPPP